MRIKEETAAGIVPERVILLNEDYAAMFMQRGLVEVRTYVDRLPWGPHPRCVVCVVKIGRRVDLGGVVVHADSAVRRAVRLHGLPYLAEILGALLSHTYILFGCCLTQGRYLYRGCCCRNASGCSRSGWCSVVSASEPSPHWSED